MRNDKELLQQALDALEDDDLPRYEIIKAIKTRLAQPEPVDTNDIKEERVAKTEEQRHEPDPVAWRQWIWKTNLGLVPEENDIPLYTAPPQRKPLTDEEIDKLFIAAISTGAVSQYDIRFARAIEAAHGIKE